MFLQAQLAINATKAAVRAATTDIARFIWVNDPEGSKIKFWAPKG